jgi:hypothetical protein
MCLCEQWSDGMSWYTVWCSSITYSIEIIAAMIARMSTDTAADRTVGNVVSVDATDLTMRYASSKVCKKINSNIL